MNFDPVGYFLNPIVDTWRKAETLSKVTLTGGCSLAALRIFRAYYYPPQEPVPPAPPRQQGSPEPTPLPPLVMVNVALLEVVQKHYELSLDMVTETLEGRDKENAELTIFQQILKKELSKEEVEILYERVMEIAQNHSNGWRLPPIVELTAENVGQFKTRLTEGITKLLPSFHAPASPQSALGQLLREHISLDVFPQDKEREKELATWIALGHVQEEETAPVFHIELLMMQEVLKLETVSYDELLGLYNRFEEIKSERDKDYDSKAFELKSGCEFQQLLNEKTLLGMGIESLLKQLEEPTAKVTPTLREIQPSHRIMGEETLKLLEMFSEELKGLNKCLGTAVDNGDCFYDAVRQGLEKLGIHKSLDDLHKIIKAEVNKNIEQYRGFYKGEDLSYDNYVIRVGLTAETAVKVYGAPVWGKLELDGEILAKHFGVKIHLCERLSQKNVEAYKLESPINWTQTKAGGTNGSIEIACYPGHFVPLSPLV